MQEWWKPQLMRGQRGRAAERLQQLSAEEHERQLQTLQVLMQQLCPFLQQRRPELAQAMG
jgi:hypothetical protein